MEAFRQTYQRLCREGGLEPQQSVVAQLQEGGACCSTLNLSGQGLSSDTCSVLGRALHHDTGVTELLLTDCMLTEEGAKLLLTGLFQNTTVKVLDLKGNNLRAEGAKVLGKLLTHNQSLNRLVLEWNALGVWDEGFSLFCEGLASNAGLQQLDLRNNQISHQGASELALALKFNDTLEVLDLRWNNVGLLGGRALLEALQRNQSLVQLELAGNNIPSDALRALEQKAAHNLDKQTTLRENRSRSLVLCKEFNRLKEEKGWQFLRQMETIDRQREEMERSSRSTSIQIGQLQEALNDRKSTINSLTAKLQMREAALALCEQKNHQLGERLTQLKAGEEDLKEQQNRERMKEQEDAALMEKKLLREIQNLTETNLHLRSKVVEMEHKSKCQHEQIFELKQELTNRMSESKLRLAQAEDRLEMEKQRSKKVLEDMDVMRQQEVENVNRRLDEGERVLQERIFRLEGQRIQLEEDLSKAKALCITERTQAEEELGRVQAQLRLEEQQRVSALTEKLQAARSTLQEVQLQCSQQKQMTSDLQAKNSQQRAEMDGLQRRMEDLQQELSGKDQQRVAEVSRVRLELQEQEGRLQAERTAQGGLRERVSALERELKLLTSNHREALFDKESQMSSMMEKLRLKEAEIQRMREDEEHRASCLQTAILTYCQRPPSYPRDPLSYPRDPPSYLRDLIYRSEPDPQTRSTDQIQGPDPQT
ncbi:leucine-rich repeat-containing protein 45 isoform X2 [Antennarius striatus]|uniref:leucine-rich repeat-containing protein 45 isoform X2 n=1 Tax=Antennarius striatus TaxID=241820 RepID=UPI0035AE9B49